MTGGSLCCGGLVYVTAVLMSNLDFDLVLVVLGCVVFGVVRCLMRTSCICIRLVLRPSFGDCKVVLYHAGQC